jgi:hypothetical protein
MEVGAIMAEDKITWYDTEVIAKMLCGEHPRIDVLSLNDDGLMRMLEDAGITHVLPPLPSAQKNDVLFMIKCAISRLVEGDGGYDAHHRDAEV